MTWRRWRSLESGRGVSMTIEDKPIFLAFCQIPRFGLSASQVAAIERVVDGRDEPVRPIAMTYAEAAATLRFTSANSVRTIEKYLRVGKPGKALPGRVTRASVEALAMKGAAA